MADEPRMRSEQAGERWRQRNAPEVYAAPRKELLDLSLPDPADVRILRVIHVIIVPEDDALWSHDPEHLGCDLLFECRI
jgi:hypothetical protein